MTKKEAKRLCLLKWQIIIDNDGILNHKVGRNPELKNFPSYCAYCKINRDNCSDCPLFIDEGNCQHPEHPYYKWVISPTKEAAQAVYDLILKT